MRGLCWLSLMLAIAGLLPALGSGDEPAVAGNASAVYTDELTRESEASIARGLDYLIRAQNPDGSWPHDAGGPPDVGTTAMVCISLLGHGSLPGRGEHGLALRRGLRYLLSRARQNAAWAVNPDQATLLQRKLGQDIHVMFGALALSQLVGCADRGDEERDIRLSLRHLVRFIDGSQQQDGSWDGGWAGILTTAFAWMALRGTHESGITLDHASSDGAVRFLRDKISTGGGRSPSPLYDKAAILRILCGVGDGKTPAAQTASQELIQMAQSGRIGTYDYSSAGGEEYLALYLATDALIHEEDERWTSWFPPVRDRIVSVQNADGSWTGHHCITGRVFCTAVAVLTLELPYRFLPLVAH